MSKLSSVEVKAFIKDKLPYKILMELYKDSRASLRDIGKREGVSHHTVSKTLRELEEKYDLDYTLMLDEKALGFSEGRIITIKFETVPKIDILKERFAKDVFVQDAYLASGDYDLLLYVVGLTQIDFRFWLLKLRLDFGTNKPQIKMSTVNDYLMGFFPLRNDLLDKNIVLSNTEKKVLKLLNKNSRMKLRDLTSESKTTKMRVIYIIEKLKRMKIIKSFTTLVQTPEKRIISAYSLSLTLNRDFESFDKAFLAELIKEEYHEVVNDYSLIASTTGIWDSFLLCVFKDGEYLAKRGPFLAEEVYAQETPKIEKAILTAIIVGKWPFHLEDYGAIRNQISRRVEFI